jgi:nucleotidyl transferase
MHKEEQKQFIVDEHILLTVAMQKIDDNSNGILFVVNQEQKLCGAVSDGDIRRWILKAGALDAEVKHLMNLSPKYIYADTNDDPYHYMQEQKIRAVPLLDHKGRIVDIVLQQDGIGGIVQHKCSLPDVSVVIMAGGKGTRLYPYTKILPKPLIPIGEIPIVERIIDAFHEYGIRDFYMTVNYKKHMIQSYFSELEHPYQITYVEEDKPLGTAGSIRLIRDTFERPLFVANCDSLIRADYADIYRYHVESQNAVTLVAAMKNDVIPYGVIHAKEDGEVERMEEKPQRSYFVNTGMYVINPEMIGLIPEDTFFHMTDLTDEALIRGYKVGMYPVSEDSFLDMGEFEEMKRMEQKLKIQN